MTAAILVRESGSILSRGSEISLPPLALFAVFAAERVPIK
jgi:hypothetical protein